MYSCMILLYCFLVVSARLILWYIIAKFDHPFWFNLDCNWHSKHNSSTLDSLMVLEWPCFEECMLPSDFGSFIGGHTDISINVLHHCCPGNHGLFRLSHFESLVKPFESSGMDNLQNCCSWPNCIGLLHPLLTCGDHKNDCCNLATEWLSWMQIGPQYVGRKCSLLIWINWNGVAIHRWVMVCSNNQLSGLEIPSDI